MDELSEQIFRENLHKRFKPSANPSLSSLRMTNRIAHHHPQNSPAPNLILEMANTAALLSNQLYELHFQIQKNHKSTVLTTPTFHLTNSNHFLTPVSSGYNSIKSSTENLSVHNSNHFSNSSSLLLNSTSDYGNESENQNSTSNSISIMTSSTLSLNDTCITGNTSAVAVKKRLFSEISLERNTSLNSTSNTAVTPHKQLLQIPPQVPRIKQIRKEICKRRKKLVMWSKTRKNILMKKNLSFSSPSLIKKLTK
jgi:hypothetical protein